MSLWRQLTRGLKVLTDRAAADREVHDEVEHYLDQATAQGIARGLTPDQARRVARMELGSPTAVRQEVLASGWEDLIATFFADLQYAGRRLRRNSASTALIGLTLALGIGATTAIFSAVNPILFQALPYPHPDRVMMVWEGGGDSRTHGTFGAYREMVARTRSFEAISVLKSWQPTMTGPDQPERLEGQRVSASYFQVLGVPPALGSEFQASDDLLNGPRVVILSHRLWQRRFGADTTIVGGTITLDDNAYTVAGVMPRGFENVLSPEAELWAPLQYDLTLGSAWGHHLRTVGRLRPGSGTGQAGRELDAIERSLEREHADSYRKAELTLVPLQDDLTRGVKPVLFAVLGAVVLVLLIACVNVTNLLLARGAQRRGEFALRAALGAGRTRLVRQLLTESLLLAAIGGLLGMAVAELGVRALVALSPPGLPRLRAIGLDHTVFAFGLGLTTLVGLAFGLFPALHAARDDLGRGLRQGSRRAAGRRHGTRGALVVAEVSLAIMLLVGSGLLLRSLQRLFAIAPGFDSSHLLTMQVQTSGRRFDLDGTTQRFFQQALEEVRRVPGVISAALTSQLPFSGDFDAYGVNFESDNDPGKGYSAFRYAVSPGYFETMGIPLLRGRFLDPTDLAGAPGAVLISESLASRKFPGQDPIGQRLRIGAPDGPWYTVAGVVGDVKQVSLALTESDAVYVTIAQWRFPDNALSLVVRARGEAASLAHPIRGAVWSVDRDQPILRVATMDALLTRSAAERRFALMMFASFAMIALVLATAGIYGVLSGSVTERSREIGVRSALGAPRGSIVSMVARQGFTLAAIGGVIGVLGAVAASRVIATLLFEISRLDPVTYLGVTVLLLGVSAIACWVPAWRAARIDPVITLRSE